MQIVPSAQVNHCRGLGGFFVCGGVELTSETASKTGIKYGFCRVCIAAHDAERYKLHSDEYMEYRKAYALSHPNYYSEYYEKNKEAITTGYKALKTKALQIIGGNVPKCVCCDTNIIPFLTAGHITDGGEPDVGGGRRIHQWIVGHPDIARLLLQVECISCNMAKIKGHICPHKLEARYEVQHSNQHVHDKCDIERHCTGWICGGIVLNSSNSSKGSRCCKNCRSVYNAMYADATRIYCFDALGGICVCCGEWRSGLLQLSHPNNDGLEDRNRWSGRTGEVYRHFYKNDFKHDYELIVECANCNFARLTNDGICPHKVIP